MKPTTRQNAILDHAQSGLRIEVDALAAAFDTSRETIRRDLAQLDRVGLLRRVHGGAMLARPPPAEEHPFDLRMQQNVAAKRAIARHVAAGLRPGDSLFIDTGTTTLYLAEEFRHLKGLIIITNSADIAHLAQRGSHQVILIGGEYRGPGRESVGAMALAQIASLHASQALLTVAAVTPQGAYDIDPQEAEIARAMIRQSRLVTVLADSSKMNMSGVFEIAPISGISRLVTDAAPPAIRAAVTTVEVAAMS